MKRYRLFFIVFASFLFLGWKIALAQDWSAEISVSGSGTTTPDFDIDPYSGHLHIVTMIEPKGVLYTEIDKNGVIVQQYVLEFADCDKASGGNAWGATIAVDPQGRPHVCYRSSPIGATDPKYTTYYAYWNGLNWTSPTTLSTKIKRGWVIRLDVDSNGKAHVARGSMLGDPDDEHGNVLAGPAKYFRLSSGVIESTLDDITRYCADDRLEIDVSYQSQVHLILGTSDYPDYGGDVWYWRTFDNGNTWYQNEISHQNARLRNGSPDIFVDLSGIVHIVYGSTKDFDVGKTASVRYSRFQDNDKQFDIPVTEPGDIAERDFSSQGIGSVAASGDGEIVIVVYSEDFGSYLWARESYNGGQTWSGPTLIANESGSAEGRNKHLIRAYSDKFYVIYPSPTGVKLRYKKFSENFPPTADAGGPYEDNEGSTISFDASGSTDPEDNITGYEWDFHDDGTYDKTTTSPYTTYAYPDDFTGQARVRVTDNEFQTSTDVAAVTIHNVPPTAYAGGLYNGELNEAINFQGSADDPGVDDLPILLFEWDFNNDGSADYTGQNVQWTYSNGGLFKVVLTVSDDDGGSDTDTATVSIQNDPPTIGYIADQEINEGESFEPINLYAAVTDPDNEDDEIGWNFANYEHLNITILYDSLAYIAPADPEWNGSETRLFIATDPGSAADTAEVTFTIIGVNDPPQVADISISPINEGQMFDPIFLNNYVEDPDDEKDDIVWTVSGQHELTIDIDQYEKVALIITPHNDWYGSETVIFEATDRNGAGLSDNCNTTITVYAVNDPPVISQGLDHTIHHSQQFPQINLDDYVNDVDNPVEAIQWSHYGENLLTVDITNRILTIDKPYAEWLGSEDITFIATDGELSDTVTATFEVVYHNDPPVAGNFNDETINENGEFGKIYLDDKVYDPDHADNKLMWSVEGNTMLYFEGFSQRILTIAPADSEWAGSETVTFIVTDPGGLKDSAEATYTIIADNDPPELGTFPEITFNEDTNYIIKYAELQIIIFDPDNSLDQLQISIGDNIYTHASVNQQTGDLVFSADPDWYGVEEVLLNVVDDQFGMATKPLRITVNPKPDPPGVFNLLHPIYGTFYSVTPPSITFVWEKAIDPDIDDIVTYTWNLSRNENFEHIIEQYNALTDTFKTYYIPSDFHSGVHYWQVIAKDGSGNNRVGNSAGAFNMEQGIGIESDENKIPTEFTLLPNQPNPFNPETKITYQLPRSCYVRLQVYNSLGQMIRTLVDQNQTVGTFSTVWNGRNSGHELVSSGIYIFKIEADEYTMARKMLLLR